MSVLECFVTMAVITKRQLKLLKHMKTFYVLNSLTISQILGPPLNVGALAFGRTKNYLAYRWRCALSLQTVIHVNILKQRNQPIRGHDNVMQDSCLTVHRTSKVSD